MLVSLPLYKLTLLLAVAGLAHEGLALSDTPGDGMRQNTPRLRAEDGFSNLQATQRVFQQRQEPEPTVAEKDDGNDAMTELMNSFNVDEMMLMMSMDVTMEPTTETPTSLPTDNPSGAPTLAPTSFTPSPTESTMPSLSPSVSLAPSPSEPTTEAPSGSPTLAPTDAPTIAPVTNEPTIGPTDESTSAPSSPPTKEVVAITTELPTATPSSRPTSLPSTSPTQLPSVEPTAFPTTTPTVEGCSVSADVRVAQIMALLDSVADPVAIRDGSTSQGQATNWLLNQDPRKICPDNPKFLQRWVLAVIYFSTGGDNWFQCSNSILADDPCGTEDPFENKQRFLSGFSECDWAGIECIDDCVTEIEFGKHALFIRVRVVCRHC